MYEMISRCEADTESLARDIAGVLPSGGVVCLAGDLGAGKTVFARAFVQALAGTTDIHVASPTFNIVLTYDTPSGVVAHYDLYRVKDDSELQEIGIEEIGANRATLIEWPERLGTYAARMRKVVSVHITILPDEYRKIEVDIEHIGVHVDTCMILAAGLGTRMAPLTHHVPKPLVEVNGRPILSYVCDSLKTSGIDRIVMNAHYFPEKVTDFAEIQRPRFNDVAVSLETDLLETGGGIQKALPMINRDVFLAINGDALLVDGPGLPFFTRLQAAFDPARMDILLLLYPVDGATITPTVGDYDRDDDGRLVRSLDLSGRYMFAGARILHARVFDDVLPGRFSFRDQMDKAQEKGRLFGLIHTGEWHHLSTPDDVRRVGDHLRDDTTKQQAVG